MTVPKKIPFASKEQLSSISKAVQKLTKKAQQGEKIPVHEINNSMAKALGFESHNEHISAIQQCASGAMTIPLAELSDAINEMGAWHSRAFLEAYLEADEAEHLQDQLLDLCETLHAEIFFQEVSEQPPEQRDISRHRFEETQAYIGSFSSVLFGLLIHLANSVILKSILAPPRMDIELTYYDKVAYPPGLNPFVFELADYDGESDIREDARTLVKAALKRGYSVAATFKAKNEMPISLCDSLGPVDTKKLLANLHLTECGIFTSSILSLLEAPDRLLYEALKDTPSIPSLYDDHVTAIFLVSISSKDWLFLEPLLQEVIGNVAALLMDNLKCSHPDCSES